MCDEIMMSMLYFTKPLFPINKGGFRGSSVFNLLRRLWGMHNNIPSRINEFYK